MVSKQIEIPGLDHYAVKSNGKLLYVQTDGWVYPPDGRRKRNRKGQHAQQETLWDSMA